MKERGVTVDTDSCGVTVAVSASTAAVVVVSSARLLVGGAELASRVVVGVVVSRRRRADGVEGAEGEKERRSRTRGD